MTDSDQRSIGPPRGDLDRLPVHVTPPGPGKLTLATPRERAAYLAGRRVRLLYTVLLLVAAAAAGAWFAGMRIQSPAEIAARVAPPPPSPILVPIEQKVLSADVVTRGTIRFGLPQPVSLAPSPLKTGAGVLTSLPLRNTQVHEGDVLFTASGRPVFVLQGQAPAYRDLVPDLAGEDVRQLKQALVRLGFDPGPVDGPYDHRTGDAVAAWYKSKGWEAFGPTRDQIATIRALERDWADAVRANASAAAAVATAGIAVNAARAAAAHNVKAAAVDNAARMPLHSQAARGQGDNPLMVESERAKAKLANSAADADLAAQIAEQSLIALDPRQTETARKAANAKLEVARAARQKIRLEGEMAVQAAERDAALIAGRTDLGRTAEYSARLEGEKAVRAALDAQNLAALDLKIATERGEQVATDLKNAKRKLGIQVPIDEVVFLPTLPVRVEELVAAVGHSATGTVLTVTDNQLSVDSALPLDAAALVKPGMPVAIDEQALGIKATGVVETVATTPGTRGVDGFHIYLGVRIENAAGRLDGFSVRLTIPIESTGGAVLAVPVSALSLAMDGSSRVQLERNGALEYVTVKPGLSAKGYVEITPAAGGLLPGQHVVVGYGNLASRDAQ
jgi:peptidoglycan hydrolase-like protein with peptidoglycan-binding domain